MPVCLRCALPVDPLQNFCGACGAPTGRAASLPFESEVLMGQAAGLAWRRAFRARGRPFHRRCFDLFFVLLTPVLFVVALLVTLPRFVWRKLRRRAEPRAGAR